MSKKKKKRKTAKSTATKKAPTINRARISSRKTAVQSFEPDYSYVIKDLKRIGILAGSFIVILVVLSFFIS